MGGRGSFVDADAGNFSFVEKGQKYFCIGEVDNVKILIKDPYLKESINQPFLSHSPNAIYATVNNGVLKYLTFYGPDHKIINEIALQHSHDGVRPHKHPNGDHSLYDRLSPEEEKLISKIKRIGKLIWQKKEKTCI